MTQSFIQLHQQDNVVIALKNFSVGELIVINGQSIRLLSAINFGHKIAATSIQFKKKVLKYGLPIGSATRDIQPGEHVHSHNLQTDYQSER